MARDDADELRSSAASRRGWQKAAAAEGPSGRRRLRKPRRDNLHRGQQHRAAQPPGRTSAPSTVVRTSCAVSSAERSPTRTLRGGGLTSPPTPRPHRLRFGRSGLERGVADADSQQPDGDQNWQARHHVSMIAAPIGRQRATPFRKRMLGRASRRRQGRLLCGS